jgi:hypothetical protein
MKKVFLIMLLVTAIGTFVVYQASIAQAKAGDLVLTSKKVQMPAVPNGTRPKNRRLP